jgi:hypothetical protein
MADLSDFVALSTPQKGPRCSVAIGLEVLDDEHRTRLLAAVASPEVTATAIQVRTGQDDWPGPKVNDRAVSRHRRGLCQCQKT